MNKISYLSIVGLLALAPLISGCAGNKKIEIHTIEGKRPALHLPSVDRIVQDPVKFYAIADGVPAGQKGSIEDFWAFAKKKGYTTGLVLTPDEYKKIVSNNQRLRKFILQNKALLRAYQEYYQENK